MKKRAKVKNLRSNVKVGIACDDPGRSNGSQSGEVINSTFVQAFEKDENLLSEKERLGRQEKSVELERPMITSTRKKRRLSADLRGTKTTPKGDLALTTTPNIVKEKHATKSAPIPVVMGLQCLAVTVSQSKSCKQLTSRSPQHVVEPAAPQSGAPFAPKTTGNQEKREMDSDTVTNGKRGSRFKRQSKTGKTSLAVNNQNGDASVKKAPSKSGRNMISLNTSPPQDIQDSSVETENEGSEINLEKSFDTVSDDQPLSRWFLGKLASAAVESTGKKLPENSKSILLMTDGDGQTLTFEKRSPLWETFKSMEAFRLIPQNPHFRPLDNFTESARERHAINKMVDFSSVYEETRRLHIDHPRTEIEDQLNTLTELETNGFNVYFLRNRLMELLSIKDHLEGLESRSKEVKDNIGNHRVEVERLGSEIKLIDKQVSDLLEKRGRISEEKEKMDSEIVVLEGEIDEIDEGMREYRYKFDELATASFV